MAVLYQVDLPETDKPTFRPPSSVRFTPDTCAISSPSRAATRSPRAFVHTFESSSENSQDIELSQAWTRESFAAPTVAASNRINQKCGPELRPSGGDETTARSHLLPRDSPVLTMFASDQEKDIVTIAPAKARGIGVFSAGSSPPASLTEVVTEDPIANCAGASTVALEEEFAGLATLKTTKNSSKFSSATSFFTF